MPDWAAHLPCKGFEESGRSHNGVGDVAGLPELGLQGQLGMLELQQGLLDAHSAEEHKVGGAACPGSLQGIQGGLIVDCPRVFLCQDTGTISKACTQPVAYGGNSYRA